jgi:chromosome segregation ATPase
MKYNEIINEDDSLGDYRQMTNFINRNKTPGVPADQQVALALYRELQKQQRQNNELSAELSAAEKRIDTATQSGELSQQELGKHRGELEKERERGDKQKASIGKLDQAHAAREQASEEQIQQLASQLETIKGKPGVSAEAGKALEQQIQELKSKGGGINADKLQELEQAVANMQNMQQVDDTAVKDLVAQVKNAQRMADELAKSKSSLGQDVEQTTAQLQTQLDQMKQQLANFREVEQTVSALQPMVQDVLAPKVDKLIKKQDIADKVNLIKTTQAVARDEIARSAGKNTLKPQAPVPNPQMELPGIQPVAEDKMSKLIKWATSK